MLRKASKGAAAHPLLQEGSVVRGVHDIAEHGNRHGFLKYAGGLG